MNDIELTEAILSMAESLKRLAHSQEELIKLLVRQLNKENDHEQS